MNRRMRRSTFTILLTLLPIWSIAVIMALALSECTEENIKPIPRRTAYPRITVCDTLYKKTSLLPINFEINAEATAINLKRNHTNDKSLWVDINYPIYNGTLSCTFSQAADSISINKILDNRTERIALNLGESSFEITDINTPHGISGKIFLTQTNMVTPLMFLATNHHNWVLSGSFGFNLSQTINYDSVAPILDAVNYDLIHAIKTLKNDDY